MPKVSVLTPLYNTKEEYLRPAIESILNQTYTDFEFLILNDTPENKELKKIVESYNDRRIFYYENDKNTGISNSRNKLLDLSKGQYIAVFDHDDISLPKRFEKQVKYLDKHNDIGVVSSNFMWMSNKKTTNFPRNSKEIKIALQSFCSIIHTGSMIRKSVLLENNIRYEQEFSPCEDLLLWTRLMNKTNFHNLKDILVHYRDYDNTTQKIFQKMEEMTKKITDIMYSENPDLLHKKYNKKIVNNQKHNLADYLKKIF